MERTVGIVILIILGVAFLFAVVLSSCKTNELVEVQLQNATIIKIDTVTRWPKDEALITWLADDGVKYAQFDQLPTKHYLGEQINALFRK